LLFGFGQENVLPRTIFAYLDPKRNTPKFNIWIVGIFAFAGSLLLEYQLTGELLSFGAFLGFMGVNSAAIRQFFILSKGNRRRRLLADGLVPAVGFLFCFAIWLGLERSAKIVGGTWFLAGLLYDAVRTRSFRLRATMLEVDDAQPPGECLILR
jgi:amino acid transporter